MQRSPLKYAVVLAQTLSFTKAAEELGLTQSALSRSIQTFEQSIGIRLFDRERGGDVHLTVSGQRFIDRARPLLQELDEVTQMLERSARAEEGDVVFGAAPLPAKALLLPMMRQNLMSLPDLRYNVAIRNADALTDMVMKGEIEFCICPAVALRAPGLLRGELLGRFPLSFLVRRGHPLLALPDGAQDWDFPLIVSATSGAEELALITSHPQFLRSPQIVMEDIDTLARLTETTDAIWLGSTFAAMEELRDGRLCELPARSGSQNQHFGIMVYSRERRTLSPGAVRIKTQLKEQVRMLRAQYENR